MYLNTYFVHRLYHTQHCSKPNPQRCCERHTSEHLHDYVMQELHMYGRIDEEGKRSQQPTVCGTRSLGTKHKDSVFI